MHISADDDGNFVIEMSPGQKISLKGPNDDCSFRVDAAGSGILKIECKEQIVFKE